MSFRFLVVLSILIAAVICLSGCNGSKPTGEQPASIGETAETTPPGTGVDPALWTKLTSELERVLAEEGTAKRTSEGPIGKASQVPDLGARGGGSGTLYEWSYRNQGDYDLNGVVNISDLTQVGLHFNKSTLSSDWQQAQIADGDNNGVVNIGDVTPIGQNFGGQVDGFEFQFKPPLPDAEFTLVESYPFIPGSPVSGQYPLYVRDTLVAIAGPSYRVVPYAESDGDRDYGIPSNVYDSTDSNNKWRSFRANDGRTSQSLADGPTEVGSTWETEIEGNVLITEPIVDFMGTIYIGTYLGELTDSTSTGYMYALDGDGEVQWRFKAIGGIVMTAAANRQGRIVFGDTSGNYYCLTRDGKQIWRRQLSGLAIYSGTLLDDAGNAFVLSVALAGGSLGVSTLYRIAPDGTVAWSRTLNDSCLGAPFYNLVSNVCVVDQSGEVYSFDYDGNSTFNFILPEQPKGGFFFLSSGVTSYGAGMIFGDTADNLRIHLYDDSFSATKVLGEEPASNIAINTQIHYVFATTEPPDDVLHLNYFDTGGNELWDIVLGGNLVTSIAVDQTDRIYLSTFFFEDGAPTNNNGISCIRADQTIEWFYPTGTRLALSPIIADEDLIVATYTQALFGGSGTDTTTILGIRGS